MVSLSPKGIVIIGILVAGAVFVLPTTPNNVASAETPSPSPTPMPSGTPIAAPAPGTATKGACYIWGKECKNGLTKEACTKEGFLDKDLPPFSFWKEGAKCHDKLLPAVEQASIDCKGRDPVRDAAKITEELQRVCLEELKEKEEAEKKICEGRGEVLIVSYRLHGGWVYNPTFERCVATCAALLQCVNPKDFILI